MLSKKKKEFCEQYIVDFNGTQACIRAGYSANTAYAKANALLKEQEVKDYLNQLLRERRSSLGITTAEIVQGLKQIAMIAERDSDKIKAFELLGKYLGIWTDKKEIKVSATMGFDDLTDEELEDALNDLE